VVSVIAISRTLGAGGEDLGTNLARELGFRYVDSEIIDRAAEQAGVEPGTIARTEVRKPLVARILENLARGSAGVMPVAAEFAPYVESAEIGYEHLITEVILATAAQGKVVIVAHGASIPLAGTEGLLRILVTASPEVRASRVTAAQAGPASNGKRLIGDSDKSRADYFRRFYRVEHELPTHYDIVVNTDVLDVTQATTLVLAVAKT
jgi:cytidylate kinase